MFHVGIVVDRLSMTGYRVEYNENRLPPPIPEATCSTHTTNAYTVRGSALCRGRECVLT